MLAIIAFASSSGAEKTYAQGSIKPNVSVLFGDVYEDGYNFGIGGRAGITLPIALPLTNEVYIGALGMYHMDDSDVLRIPTDIGLQSVELETQIDYVGFEIGFPVLNKGLRIRTSTVVGRAAIKRQEAFLGSDNVTILIAEDTSGEFLISSGLVFSFPIGPYSIGAEARYVDVDGFNGFATFGTVGLAF